MMLTRKIRRLAGGVLRRLGLRSAPAGAPRRPWVVAEDNPSDPQRLPAFRLFAVVGTWHEGDVVEALVRNALAQGCERVYVVDNDSPDDTVEAALRAGAILAESFSTEGYDEKLRVSLMNRTVQRVTEEVDDDHVWWLYMDADEFPHGPGDMTLRDYLATLDRRFRIVGTRYFNHYPKGTPHYVPGFHPLDFQPLCEEFDAADFHHCQLDHWSHPLRRQDKGAEWLTGREGLHRVTYEVQLIEPTVPIVVHHFPFRDRSYTIRRLNALCGPDESGHVRNEMNDERVRRATGITKRYRCLEHVYAGRWDQVENLRISGNPLGVHPRGWSEVSECDPGAHKKWYPQENLEGVIYRWREREAAAEAGG